MNNANQHIPAGYKSSPLGIIPENWEVKRLGEIGTFKNGLNFTINEEGFSYYFLGVGDFQEKTDIHTKELGQIRLAKELDKEYHLKDDDLVFVRSNGSKSLVGRCVIIHTDHVKATYSGFCIRFRPTNEGTSAQYIKQIIDAGYLRRFLQHEGRGTNITNLNQEILGRLSFPFPDYREQQDILKILQLWDTAISKQTQLVEKLTLRKRGIMQQLLTGKKRLKGFEGEWKEVKLGEICDINKGEQVNTDTLTETGLFPVINGGIMPSGYKEEYNTEANTITISEGGNSCGFVNLIKTKFWSGGHCYTLSNIVNFDLNYLYYSLKFAEPHIMNLRVGSGLPNIQLGPLQKFILLMPQLEEQKANSAILIESDNEIEIQKQKLTSLQEQKKGLMQVLLSGKKRIE